MSTKPNKYFGVTEKSLKTESFNVSVTNHSMNSEIAMHSHGKPYLCLLAYGTYKEKSNVSDIIIDGEVIFRTSNYEHSNMFSDKGGVCLNIEINDYDQLVNLNGLQLPNTISKQKGTVELYKLLYGLKCGLPNDIINIYCYESMISTLNSFNKNGDVIWINKVKDYINDNPLEAISLNKLSLEFSLHPNYIVRKFKEITGYKLSDYLTKIRLEYSIKQLIENEKNLTTIALESGFYDQSHFNRNFKQQLETTPSYFRKIITS